MYMVLWRNRYATRTKTIQWVAPLDHTPLQLPGIFTTSSPGRFVAGRFQKWVQIDFSTLKPDTPGQFHALDLSRCGVLTSE